MPNDPSPDDPDKAARIARARALNDAVPADRVIHSVRRLFDFVEAGDDQFSFPALPETKRPRIFGGQVIAQAMMAATRTVDPSKPVHSLHAYFLRGGQETLPLDFAVHRDFDGRTFSNRRVVVRQQDKVIFNLTASFQSPEPGPSHQVAMADDILPPEDCWDFADFLAAMPGVPDALLANMARPRPFEIRSFRPEGGTGATRHYQWFRLRGDIGDDQLLHRAFLAFASDMGLLSTTLLPHGFNWFTPGLFSTSIDHALWFHADICVSDWFVYVMDSDWTGGSRGIARGRIYRQDGTLIASVAQEGLLRYQPPA